MSTNQWELLQKIGFVRVSGSAEEKQAAEILREEVEARGEKARLEMFEVAGQVIKKVSCATEKTSYPVTAYGNCGETDETGLTAPFYYMEVPGPVSLQQASGKIVLVNGYLNYKLYQSLIDSGAVGFITYNGEARDSEETTDIAHRELREKLAELAGGQHDDSRRDAAGSGKPEDDHACRSAGSGQRRFTKCHRGNPGLNPAGGCDRADGAL